MKLRTPFQLAIAALFVLSKFATAQLPVPMPAQPELAQLCQPHLAKLRSAGIVSITATGSGHFVRLATNAGALYFRYPGGVPSTEFALRVTAQGIQASSSDFAKSKSDEYRAAVNSILTEAISRATSNNNWLAEERMTE
jgi:hypothetical protein